MDFRIEFEYWNNQPLHAGDIVICDEGGLGVVASGNTGGEATRIDGISESWSCEIRTDLDASGILQDNEGAPFDKIIRHADMSQFMKF